MLINRCTITEKATNEKARRKNNASHAIKDVIPETARIDKSLRIVTDTFFDHAVLENSFFVEKAVLIELAITMVSAILKIATVDNRSCRNVEDHSVTIGLPVGHVSRVKQLGANAVGASGLGRLVLIGCLQLGSAHIRAGTVGPVVRFRSALS